MPILRMLAGGAMSFGAPGYIDASGDPGFRAHRGTTTLLTVDWAGAAGAAGLDSVSWEASGLAVSLPTIAGKRASALIALGDTAGQVVCRADLTDGRVLAVTIGAVVFGATGGSAGSVVTVTETLTPDGTGAVTLARDVWIKRLLDVDIYSFGADPTAPGSTNDAAIANAVARANAIGGVLRAELLPGTYDFSAAIPALTTAAGIDTEASIFRDTGSLTVPFMTVGGLIASGYWHKVVRGIKLRRVSQSDWSDEGCIGLLLTCVRFSDMTIDEVRGFTIGARLEGKSDGSTSADATHNDIRLGLIYNNKIGLDFYSNAGIAAGAPNQNRIYGGDFTCDTGVNTSTDRYGVAFRRASGGYANHNGNVMYAPSFQHARSGSGIAYCVLHETNGSQNMIHDARAEIGSGTMRAYYNNGGGGDNLIELNYSTGYTLTPGVDGASATRFAWDVSYKRYASYALRAMRPLLDVPNLRETMFLDVYSGNTSYGLDDLHIAFVSDPGGSATAADVSLRNSQGSAVTPTNTGVQIASGRGIGCLLDTRELKTFSVLYELAEDDSNGKIQVRCFDASGVIMDDSDGDLVLVDHPSVSVSYNGTSRGWVMGNEASLAANSTRLGWKVADAVKTVEIALVWGGTDIEVRRFGVFTAEPINAKCWHGVTGGTSHLQGSKTHDFASTADAAAVGTSTTVTGTQFGDHVLASVGVSIGVAVLHGYVQAANTPACTLFNKNGSNLDLASTTLSFDVYKRRVPYT